MKHPVYMYHIYTYLYMYLIGPEHWHNIEYIEYIYFTLKRETFVISFSDNCSLSIDGRSYLGTYLI